MTNKEKAIALNTIWYNVICGEYHKDRDCHFYIYSHYFYGDSAEYIVEHKGYINHDYEDTIWNTYEEAELELVRLLKQMLLNEIDWYLTIPEAENEYSEEQHGRYDKEQLGDIRKKVLEIAPD
jgi:hypothetical protein